MATISIFARKWLQVLGPPQFLQYRLRSLSSSQFLLFLIASITSHSLLGISYTPSDFGRGLQAMWMTSYQSYLALALSLGSELCRLSIEVVKAQLSLIKIRFSLTFITLRSLSQIFLLTQMLTLVTFVLVSISRNSLLLGRQLLLSNLLYYGSYTTTMSVVLTSSLAMNLIMTLSLDFQPLYQII